MAASGRDGGGLHEDAWLQDADLVRIESGLNLLQTFDDFQGGLPAGRVRRFGAGAGGQFGGRVGEAEAADGGDRSGETVSVAEI